jgi:regulator of PEP synthase PpsR (kinase-PPPase family)
MTVKNFHLHLVSDSTGETVSSVSRAALAQFEGIEAEEHTWAMIRTKGQIEKLLEHIKQHPGIVFFTIADDNLADMLRDGCNALGLPTVPVIKRPVQELSRYLGIQPTHRMGVQHAMDADYFERVDVVNFALAHDDGQAPWELEEADIVVVGVSRTSKSPTTMYLAYRGYKAANVPFVPGCDLPDIEKLKNPLVVGLTINSERLEQIRKSRLASLDHPERTNYTDTQTIEDELEEARRYFNKHKWPIIDVTRRSVEETAAIIIQKYQDKKERG